MPDTILTKSLFADTKEDVIAGISANLTGAHQTLSLQRNRLVQAWSLAISAKYAWDFFWLLYGLSSSGWDLTFFADRWPRIWIVTRFLMIFPLLSFTFSRQEKDSCGVPSKRLTVFGTALVILFGFFLRLYAATALHCSEFEVFYAGLHFEGAELRLDAFRPVFYPFLQYASWMILERVDGFRAIPQALIEGNIAARYPSSWIFASRMLSVVMSTISLVLIWIVTRNLFGEKAGFWATLLHAVNYYVVTGPDSRSHDENPAILFLLASVAVLTREGKRTKEQGRHFPRLVLSGALSGLSFISRSPMLIYSSSLTGFIWWSEGISSVGYFLLGFFPVLFLEGLAELLIRGSFLGGVLEFLRFNIIAGHASDWGTNPWYEYILLVSVAVGLVVYLLPFGVEKDSKSILLGFLILPFLAAFSVVPHKEHRYVSPIFPFIHILIGKALSKLNRKHPSVLAAVAHTVIHGIAMIVFW